MSFEKYLLFKSCFFKICLAIPYTTVQCGFITLTGDGILLYEANGIEKAEQQAGMMQILGKAGGKLETSIATLQSNAHKSFTPLKLITHAFHVTLGASL